MKLKYQIIKLGFKPGAAAGSEVETEADDEKTRSQLGASSSLAADSSSCPTVTSRGPTPDISVSPIVGAGAETGGQVKKKTSTSTPLPPDKQRPPAALSSPQKLVRKRAAEAKMRQDEATSEEEGEEQGRVERAKKTKKCHNGHKEAEEATEFKSPVTPGGGETVISFTVSDPASLELAEVRAALAVLRGAGIRQIQDSWQPPVKKRLSDGSTISAGYISVVQNIVNTVSI